MSEGNKIQENVKATEFIMKNSIIQSISKRSFDIVDDDDDDDDDDAPNDVKQHNKKICIENMSTEALSQYNVSIKIDNNEHFLKRCFMDIYSDKPKQNLSFETLPIGDIVFYINDVPCLLIERKNIKDLVASIGDKRLWSQRARGGDVKKKNPNLSIALIIEGNLGTLPYDKYEKLTEIGLKKIIWSFSYVYGIPILTTVDIWDTIRLIACIEIKYKAIGNPINMLIDINVANSVYIGLKKPSDSSAFNDSVLTLINGVSIEMSKSIMEKYKSISRIISAYNDIQTQNDIENEKNKLLMLVGITYITSKGKTRKIGKIISKRIYCYLFGL